MPNLRRLRPDYVVHGSDWKNGVQNKTREDAAAALKEWGGALVEPEYTPNISTTAIIARCHARERSRREDNVPAVPAVAHASLSAADAARAQQEALRVAEDGDDGGGAFLCFSAASGGQGAARLARPVAYVAVTSDVMHHGVIAVIRKAASVAASVVVGLLSDEASASLSGGGGSAVPFEGRLDMYREVKGVSRVVPQLQLDYTPSLACLRPEFVVHGDDWRDGEQREVRAAVVRALSAWGGELVETGAVKFAAIEDAIERECFDRVEKKKEKEAVQEG